MHYIDDKVFHVFETVKKYMMEADSINVEYVPKKEGISIIEKLLFNTDTHIKDRLTEDQYKKFLNIIKNIPLKTIEYASPFHILNLIICSPEHTRDLHMDAQIIV